MARWSTTSGPTNYPMRLLITGAGGMLGQDVVRAAQAAGADCTARTRVELDVTDRDAVEASIRIAEPDVVVNCAAWTDVDGAESEVESAFAVNATGAANLARCAA